MSQDTNVIKDCFTGRLTCDSRHDHGAVKISLRWSSDAPLEVSIWITKRSGEDDRRIKLVTLRDTLLDAYANHVNDSYVFGVPGALTLKTRDGESRQVVMRVYGLQADGDLGHRDLITLRSSFQVFLDKTLRVTPRGQEVTEAGVDRALAEIMGD